MLRVQNLKSELARRVECEAFGKYVKISDDQNNFCIMPEVFTTSYMKRIKEMKVFEDDIWIVTYPKCGTTWTQEMVWLICNNLNYEVAKSKLLDERVPFLEMGGLSEMPFVKDTFEACENLPRPRIIKSHLPAFLLPDEIWTVKPKIVYVARNPKDAAVSWYHHHRNLHGWVNGTRLDFIQAFVADKMLYNPMNDQILKFWEMRKEPNIIFLFFEDMKRSLIDVINQLLEFLGKSYSHKEIDELIDHLSFDKMKDNKAVNKSEIVQIVNSMAGKKSDWNFIRRGKVGSYEDELTLEEIELLQSYINNIDSDKTDFKYK